MYNVHTKFELPDRSYANIVKKDIRKISEEVNFSPNQLGEIDIIVSELISNVVKHAKSPAEILVKKITKNTQIGLEIICIDKGVGMENVTGMMKDGTSTSQSLGQGLGAIQRLSDDFDIYSLKDWGTVILTRIFTEKPLYYQQKEKAEIFGVVVPKRGETLSGDGWHLKKMENNIQVLAVDGLGHGPEAHAATAKLIDFFLETELTGAEFLKEANVVIRRTRGAVAAITGIDFDRKFLSFCGIGNISCRLISKNASNNCLSYNGIVGHSFPVAVKESIYTLASDDIIILTSDGITSRWDLSKFPGITQHDASIIASVLYKDHNRGNDDSMVVVIRENK